MKNTLKLYEELKASGVSEEQAKIQAYQLGDVRDIVGEVRNSLEAIHRDMKWIMLIGAALIASQAYLFVNLKHLLK